MKRKEKNRFHVLSVYIFYECSTYSFSAALKALIISSAFLKIDSLLLASVTN